MGTKWSSKAHSLPDVPIAIPPEFMGPGGGYSPEDLFAMSILNCIIATFKVYADKGGAPFSEVKGKAELTVDRLPDSQGIAMTHIDIYIDVLGASNEDKIKMLLDKAIKDCAVGNSIKSGKTFHINIAF